MFVVAVCNSPAADVFENPFRIKAGGEFIDVTTQHAAPHLRDMDGDGVRDLLVGEFGIHDYTGEVSEKEEWAQGRVRVYHNLGTERAPRYGKFEYLQAGGVPAAVPITCCLSFVPHFADLDGDGIEDLMSASYPGDLYFFKGLGKEKYAAAKTLRDENGNVVKPVTSATMEAHDMDADGDLDLIIGSRLNGCFVVTNIGTRQAPKWSAKKQRLLDAKGKKIGGWNYGSNVHFADWDGDGVSDIVVGSDDGGIFWHRNLGKENAPSFGPKQTLVPVMSEEYMFKPFPTPTRCGWRVKVHVADYNGDGTPDLLAGDYGPEWILNKKLTLAKRARRAELITRIANLKGKENKVRKKALRKELKKLAVFKEGEGGGWVWVYLRKPTASATGSILPEAAAVARPDNANVQGEVEFTILTKAPKAKVGEAFEVKLKYKIAPGWHIGPSKSKQTIPTELEWTLPEGVKVTDVKWPELNYFGNPPGYEGIIIVTAKLQADKDLKPGAKLTIGVRSSWQVCKGICKLGERTQRLKILVK